MGNTAKHCCEPNSGVAETHNEHNYARGNSSHVKSPTSKNPVEKSPKSPVISKAAVKTPKTNKAVPSFNIPEPEDTFELYGRPLRELMPEKAIPLLKLPKIMNSQVRDQLKQRGPFSNRYGSPPTRATTDMKTQVTSARDQLSTNNTQPPTKKQTTALTCVPTAHVAPTSTQEGIYKLGPVRLSNGDIYLGEWEERLPCGYGVLMLAEGSLYEGFLLRGLPHGEGRLILSSGNVYEGEFISGKAQGYGTFFSKNYVIKGTWYDNLPNGNCTELWSINSSSPTGPNTQNSNHLQTAGLSPLPATSPVVRFIQTATISFCGAFSRGKRNGSGTAMWPNGDKLKGHFSDGLLSGFGSMFWKDSNIEYQGAFDQDCIQGTGVLKYPSNASYRGEFKNDFPHGQGTFETEDKVFKGNWANGFQEGAGSVFIKGENKTIQGYWSRGVMNMPDVPVSKSKPAAIFVTKAGAA